MFEKFHRKSLPAAVAALITALGVGGVAVAQNQGSSPSKPAPNATPAPSTATPPAADQPTPGDQPDTPGGKADAETNDGPDPAGAKDTPDAQDKAGAAETPDAQEPAGGTETGSETVADDGPGGHADEPGNPNADTQQQGQN